MNEFKRICGKKYVCLLVFLLVLNLVIIVSEKKDSQVINEYIEMINYADNYYEYTSYTEAATNAWQEYFKKHNINGSDTSDETAIAKQAREKLMQQAWYVDNYKEIVNSKKQTAMLYAISGTYKENSFEYNNLLKTQYDLSQISDAKVQLSNGVWLERLFENNYIHLLAFVTCVFTVYMFFPERKNRLYYIVHTAKDGRGRLFAKRCGIMLIQAIITNVTLYIESALILIKIYDGWKGLNIAAASDEYFMLTSGNLSRLELLGMMTMLSILTTVVLSFVLWVVLLCFGNVNIGLFFYSFVCVADIVIYKIVSAKSILNVLRYLNVYYLFFTNKAFEYYNWGYSGAVFSLLTTTIVVSIILGGVTLIASAYISINKYFTGKKNAIENVVYIIQAYFIRILESLNNIWKEVYKTLISQGIIWILLILIYVASNITPSHGVIYDAKKSYMLGFYEKAEGLSYGPELLSVYNDYKDEYEDFLNSFDYNAVNAGVILGNKEDLFNTMEEYVNYIKQMNEQGISAVVINPYEYTDTIGSREWNNQELIAMINVVAAIVISFGFISYEKKSMVHSLMIAGKERKRWLIRKMLVQSFLCLVFSCITYGMYYMKLCDIYTYENITAPLKSIKLFENFAINPPIIIYIFIDYMVKYLFFVVIQMVMSVISIYVKYAYCLAVGLILVLPQLLYMVGFDFLHKVSIVRYVAFFGCWMESGKTMTIYWWLLSTITLIGIAASMYIINVFQHNRAIIKQQGARHEIRD